MDTTYLREDERQAFDEWERGAFIGGGHLAFEIVVERLIEERKKNDTMHDALWQIYNWSRAYPLDVFIEPKKEDWARANEILEKSGINFSALNGATMRHVVNGIGKHARGGLGLSEKSVK